MELVHLASASQRRASMLEALGYEVIQTPLRARERSHRHGIPISEQVAHTLRGKIESAQRECSVPLVIVADTLVEDPDDNLNPMGQPGNRQEALSMLLRLSGRNHRVWSGTAVIQGETVQSWISSATVSIESLADEELEALIVSDSWRGKAGGYDLAGAMGQFAQIVDGEEETVLGFSPEIFPYLKSIIP
ncbi:MAG: Maf family protein [Candidatus Thalassarchaeaceae archaeon]|jgi:septum formation protein|nr:Maf family protein [Candidatus Thalassarchaeaceae archaeon]